MSIATEGRPGGDAGWGVGRGFFGGVTETFSMSPRTTLWGSFHNSANTLNRTDFPTRNRRFTACQLVQQRGAETNRAHRAGRCAPCHLCQRSTRFKPLLSQPGLRVRARPTTGVTLLVLDQKT